MNVAVGYVAIGRNEGERLTRCLDALCKEGERIVYVDSGSTDGSVSNAKSKGVAVQELSVETPFTAARARNAGFKELLSKWSDTALVMFIDGDCELAPGFVDAAIAKFYDNESFGIVTGRCRERFPDATIYNRLCDIEWNGPVGEIATCGGIFMVRTDAFRAIDGFADDIIAAEDDDFCIRLRESGSTVVRIDSDMCFHDADIRQFRQWWRRMERAGHAFARIGARHSGYFRAERRRAWLWGLAVPMASLLVALFTNGWGLLLLLLYPVSMWKTRAGLVINGTAPEHATLGAAFLTISKFPNLIGMMKYWRKSVGGRRVGIVEYK